jgi:uncharacterized protein with LGFP repeats
VSRSRRLAGRTAVVGLAGVASVGAYWITDRSHEARADAVPVSVLPALPGTTQQAVQLAGDRVLRIASDRSVTAHQGVVDGDGMRFSPTGTPGEALPAGWQQVWDDSVAAFSGSTLTVTTGGSSVFSGTFVHGAVTGAGARHVLVTDDAGTHLVDLAAGTTRTVAAGSRLYEDWLYEPHASGPTTGLVRTDLDTGTSMTVDTAPCSGATFGAFSTWTVSWCPGGVTRVRDGLLGGESAPALPDAQSLVLGDGVALTAAPDGTLSRVALANGGRSVIGRVPAGSVLRTVADVDESGRTAVWLDPDGSVHSLQLVPVVAGAAEPAYAASSQRLGTETDLPEPVAAGSVWPFQHGAVTVRAAGGTRVLTGAVAAAWQAAGGVGSALGWPVTDTAPTPDAAGSWEDFDGGSVYSAPGATTAHAVLGAIRDRWRTLGSETGQLGYPTVDERLFAGVLRTDFEGGYLTRPWVGGPVDLTLLGGCTSTAKAAIDLRVGAVGGAQALGAPADYQPVAGGCSRDFGANATVAYSPAVGHAALVRDVMRTRWLQAGGAASVLGYPLGEATPDGSGTTQAFQSGTLAQSGSTAPVFLVWGEIDQSWRSHQGADGPLGWPTTDVLPTAGNTGAYALFAHGSVHWSAATRAHAVWGRTFTKWAAMGYETGPLGWPRGDVTRAGSGRADYALFTGGEIFTPDSATSYPGTPYEPSAVWGAVYEAWARHGWEGGDLGAPTASDNLPTGGGGGRWQPFANGAVYWSARTGEVALYGDIWQRFRATGYEFGPLGWPTMDVWPTARRDGMIARFDNGAILWSATTGTHDVWGGIFTYWSQRGWETGRFGFPRSDVYSTASGAQVDFAGGTVRWDRGRNVVSG